MMAKVIFTVYQPTNFINILDIQYFATYIFFIRKRKICPREKKGLRREKQNH